VTAADSADRSVVNSVFGSELPQASSDERDPEASADDGERDHWLRENVPPHHI
jgi:hypothetical protein